MFPLQEEVFKLQHFRPGSETIPQISISITSLNVEV